jgi:hypothetical protein
MGHAYGELGNLFRYQRDYARAEQFYVKSLKVHYEHGLQPDTQYLQCLVLTALHQKNYPLASQRTIDCYELATKLGQKTSAYGLFIGLAAAAAGLNQPEHAARLSGMAHAILGTAGFRHDPKDRAEFDQHIQIARDRLGDVRFEALSSEGRGITTEKAVEYALEVSRSL